jgi:hypothetical protein
MSTGYPSIFSIEVMHSFFENNICNCLQFSYGKNTQVLLKRYPFLVRHKVNGLGIYADTTAEITSMLEYIGRVLPPYFDFSMQATHQNFGLFTDLPKNRSGQLTYNSGDIADILENGTVILNPAFQVLKEGVSLATIRINFEDVLKYRNTGSPAQFQISFTARATQWQYYIVNRNGLKLEWPAINGKKKIRFDGPLNVSIPGGEPALLFTSNDQLLPLSETPVYQFDLVNYPGKEGEELPVFIPASQVVYKGLPVPGPADIGFTQLNGEEVFSSCIYVYI